MNADMVLAAGLKIDWAHMPTYNTVMSVCAGVGLLLVVDLGRRLVTGHPIAPEGWALAFGVLGIILAVTGLHMTLAWPLAAGGFPFDNVIFGEPSLAFGVLMLAAALFLWKRGEVINDPATRRAQVQRLAGPLSLFVFALGLCALAIAAAGWKYTLFAAPSEEPVSGLLSDHPMIEASFISALYVLVGIGALVFPLALARFRSLPALVVVGVTWTIAGLCFMIFGALNYFTHIGLIVNTM